MIEKGCRSRRLVRTCWAMALAAAFATSCRAADFSPGSTSNTQGAAAAEQPSGELRTTDLVGANVLDRESQLVGVVDDILLPQQGSSGSVLVIGLLATMGLGEKDVAVPFSTARVSVPFSPTPSSNPFRDGIAAGKQTLRVQVDVSRKDLAAAPAFKAGEGLGKPAGNAGTPETIEKQPKSSTQSGGPG